MATTSQTVALPTAADCGEALTKVSMMIEEELTPLLHVIGRHMSDGGTYTLEDVAMLTVFRDYIEMPLSELEQIRKSVDVSISHAVDGAMAPDGRPGSVPPLNEFGSVIRA